MFLGRGVKYAVVNQMVDKVRKGCTNMSASRYCIQPFFSIAREQCIGWVTAKHSNHFGVGAYVSIQKQLLLKVICISIFKVLCRTNCKRGTDRNHFNKYTTCPNSAWSKGVRTWNESNHICRTVNKHIFTQI